MVSVMKAAAAAADSQEQTTARNYQRGRGGKEED